MVCFIWILAFLSATILQSQFQEIALAIVMTLLVIFVLGWIMQRYEAALTKHQELMRKLTMHQEKVKESEHKNIAREIHDELGQTLLVLKMDMSILHTRTANTHPKLHEKVSLSLSHIDATIKSVRNLMNNLRPAVFDLGLHAVIEWQAQEFQRKTGIKCDLHIQNAHADWDTDLDENTALIVFRIMQESLNNVLQHAQASQVHIMVNKNPHQLKISVVDNGIGIHPDSEHNDNDDNNKNDTFGLLGIRERLTALKGQLVLNSAPNQGTSLTFSIPIPVLHS
jgi:signal transduction histidine kinase